MKRQPLVLLPGLGCDGELWAAQVEGLSDIAEVTVGDTLQDDSLPAMARRILAAAPDRFALAGLSMGGYLAFEIMRQAPERVTRLALCDTSAAADTADNKAFRGAVIAEVQSGKDYAELSRASLPRLIAPDAAARVAEAVVAMAVRVGPEVYIRQQRAIMARPDSHDLLPGIAVRTLVLVGERDILTPPAAAEGMASVIPGAALAIIPGSGHLTPMERPEAVTRHLRAWLG